MRPPVLHSYLLWRSSVDPSPERLATCRYTASVGLLPAAMVGLAIYGWYAGAVLLLCIGGSFLMDYAAEKLSGRWILQNQNTTRDGSWLLAGLLVGLLLPPAVPLWVPVLAGAMAILLGKHWLSVDGMTLFQPALVALVLLHLLLTPYMHPRAEVTRVSTTTLSSPDGIKPGPQANASGPANNFVVKATVQEISKADDGAWTVSGILHNGSSAALRGPKVEVRLVDRNNEVVGSGKVELNGVDAGVDQPYSVMIAASGPAQSCEIGVLFTEVVDSWPVLSKAFVPDKTAPEASPLWILSTSLTGDIRLSVDKEAYMDLLFAGKQPMYDEGQNIVAQAMYGPRPLDLVKNHPGRQVSGQPFHGHHRYDGWDMLLGGNSGPIGGGSGLAIILGILLILFTRTVSWSVPLAAMGTLFIGLKLLGAPNIAIHLLSPYTLIGFFFLAADPVTAPRSLYGKLMAGFLVGLLELLLRTYTPLSEATFISVTIVQGMSIVFDQYLAPPRELQPNSSISGVIPRVSSLGRL